MYRKQIREDAPPSQVAYEAVAEALDRDPLILPPLGRTIDTDALDSLCDPETATGAFSTTFEYAGCTVTVTADEVTVEVGESAE